MKTNTERNRKQQAGFSLIELMMAVTVLGILAVIAIPTYTKYVQKSRLTALVMPGVHSIMNKMVLAYATGSQGFVTVDSIIDDENTSYFDVSFQPAGTNMTSLLFTIKNQPDNKFSKLDGLVMLCEPMVDAGRITHWAMSGSLADRLGLNKET